MLTQTLPRSAETYASDQRAEIAAAVAAIARQWRRVRTADIDASYARVEPVMLGIVTQAQARVAAGAQRYVPAVLAETGQDRALEAFADVSTNPLIGVAGDGRPVGSLLYRSVIGAKSQIAEGTAAGVALLQRGQWLSMAVGTLLSDIGRQSESLAIGARPVGGYVRMLTPPSCSRCVVLAGAWYRSSTAFRRHPGCDCRHIPASESLGQDMRVNQAEYFDQLSAAEQDRVFTKAGAEAIRAGADMNQVVNARRGMHTAQTASGRRVLAPVQIGGKDVFVSSEGTTRRGWAYRSLAPSGTRIDRSQTALRVTREGLELRTIERRVANRPRLMPESIAQYATDREDYLRLLRANGYIL